MKKLLIIVLFLPLLTNAQGIITTIAGTGISGYAGDGGLATAAEVNSPVAACLDASGNIIFSDAVNDYLRKISAATDIMNSIAGNGSVGCSGDSIPATTATFDDLSFMSADPAGNIYFTDQGCRKAKKLTVATNIITTIAGDGGVVYSGDGVAATAATLVDPIGICLDASGNIYIADGSGNRVRRIAVSTGIITTVAGNGTAGLSGDGGPATAAELNGPLAICFNSAGDLYIGDYSNHLIRKVDMATGVITSVIGNGTYGNSGDGGPATAASIGEIFGICVDVHGDIYISDVSNNVCRKIIAATGIIQLMAGDNTAGGYSGDGGPATAAALHSPGGICLNPSNGDLIVPDQGNHRIRKITQPGFVSSSGVDNVAPKLEMSVYPNPSTGKFVIQTSTQLNATVEVDNVIGQVIYSGELSGARTTLDISNQPGGVYFIRIKGSVLSGSRMTFRLLKE